MVVLAEIFVAALAVTGLYFLLTLVLDRLLESRRVAIAVEVLDREAAAELDLMLHETDRLRLFVGRRRLVALLSPALAEDEEIRALLREAGIEGYVVARPPE